MRHPVLLCVTFLPVLFAGCGKYSLDSYWHSGTYNLIAVDTPGQMSLVVDEPGMSSALVGPTIFSVGANDRYIVIKQHPQKDGFGNFDRSITLYFVVDRNAGSAPSARSRSVLGPLNKEQFTRLASTKALPAFTKTFQDLE